MDEVSTWSLAPCSPIEADALTRELGCSATLASILVRRGYSDPVSARAFLAAEDDHDPFLLGDMEAACDLVLRHVRAGSRIVVHGDYDVDGVSSTAVLVQALRHLGADPAWHIPSRSGDGYGLTIASVDAIAAAGAALIVTVDCAITAVDEVARAREAGIDVVVTDHHRPDDRLPDCPIVHPGLGGYPFSDLCATAVAHKLSLALRSHAGAAGGPHDERDLVALATICDVVSLHGENRRLVREGLAVLAATPRPGLRALMEIARVDSTALDERAVGFRLGPRINAAGRVGSADAALELLLTEDRDRAREVADELDLANRVRRDEQTRMVFEAERACAEQEGASAYVVAGDGWHPGVIGIVASRLAERRHRPAIVIGFDGDLGRGSGRSIPGFDLHAALAACSEHLTRFGGHRAAAGLELDRSALDEFRRAFDAHAASVLSAEDLERTERVDAAVGVSDCGLTLAEELRSLAPFGAGNREPALLLPGVRIDAVTGIGDEAQHARMSLSSGGAKARAIAFRRSPRSVSALGGEPLDVIVTLTPESWRGITEPKLVVDALCLRPTATLDEVAESTPFEIRLERGLTAWASSTVAAASAAGPGRPAGAGPTGPTDARPVVDRRGASVSAVAAEVRSGGAPLLVVCADLPRRRAGLLVAGLGGPDSTRVCEWGDIGLDPELATGQAILALDPPTDLAGESAAAIGTDPLVFAWGEPEVRFAADIVESRSPVRPLLASLYRGLGRDPLGGEELRSLVDAHDPATVGLLLTILDDLDLVRLDRSAEGLLSVIRIDAERTSLERSVAYVEAQRRFERVRRRLAEETAHLAATRDPAVRAARTRTTAP